jgi:hypothetical protein
MSAIMNSFGPFYDQSRVEYNLATPWNKETPVVSLERTVNVGDVDECAYDGDDPHFLPNCHFPATCQNRLCEDGSDEPAYDCVCLQVSFHFLKPPLKIPSCSWPLVRFVCHPYRFCRSRISCRTGLNLTEMAAA